MNFSSTSRFKKWDCSKSFIYFPSNSYSQTFVLCDVRLFLIYLGFQLPLFIYKRLFYDYAFYKKYPKTEVDALHLYFMMSDCEFGAMHVVVDIRHRPECEERNRTIGQAHQGKHIYRVWWKRFVTFKIFVCLIFIYVPMNLYCISSISENWCLHYLTIVFLEFKNTW